MAEPFIGEIRIFAFNYPPRTWGFCNGALLSIGDNTALFALIGTFYGGDGRSTMQLPNLVSRMPIAYGAGTPFPPNLYRYQIGSTNGFQEITLATSQLPQHTHSASFTPSGGTGNVAVNIMATTDDGDSATPSAGAYLSKTKATGGSSDKDENIYNSTPTAGSLVPLGGVEVSSTGGSAGIVSLNPAGSSVGVPITNPVAAVNFSMAMQGLFPPRN